MSGFYTPDGRFLATENGRPVVGAKLYVYLTGTTTPATTYKDTAMTIPNTNPVIMDSQGRAVVILDPANAYDFLLKRADDSTMSSQANIVLPASTSALAAVSSSVSAEAASRVAADTSLQNQINTMNTLPWWEIGAGGSAVDDSGSLLISKTITGDWGSQTAYNSGTGKFTIPTTGLYLITFSGMITHNGTSGCYAQAKVGAAVHGKTPYLALASGAKEPFTVSATVQCTAADLVYADFHTDSGGFGSGITCVLNSFSLARLH